MNVALDTNAYSDFMRGIPARVKVVQTAERLFLPIIVLGELRAGFAAGSREAENLQILQAFLASSRVTVLPADDETTKYYGRIFVSLRKKGITIPTNDLWIRRPAKARTTSVTRKGLFSKADENCLRGIG